MTTTLSATLSSAAEASSASIAIEVAQCKGERNKQQQCVSHGRCRYRAVKICGTRARDDALTARYNQSEGRAVATTEVLISDANDLFQRLTDIRVWLDDHRYEPSTFKYFYLDPGMMIRVSYKIDDEAEAFAQKFGGSTISDFHWTTDSPHNRVAQHGSANGR